jgi:multimeric flavodoxin WrbA
MKVLAILGSPRAKSNSSALARQIMERAGELGAETQEFVLNKLQYKGCQACVGWASPVDFAIEDYYS